jgi:N-acetylglutamate synthase-like GNAT family acetyltransferase
MQTDILSLFGYFASLIIAISMTMSSIVKFRWINLVGAIAFATYGLLIHAIPVTVLNGFIALVDIYYLIRIYRKKEVFDILEVRSDNKYLMEFLRFHNKDIHKFFPGFSYKPEMNTISFFVLRNLNVAGVFLAHREEKDILYVGLDYVTPEYRDLKNGKFIYSHLRSRFIEQGFKRVVAPVSSKKYEQYLKKLGFKRDEKGKFAKELVQI